MVNYGVLWCVRVNYGELWLIMENHGALWWIIVAVMMFAHVTPNPSRVPCLRPLQTSGGWCGNRGPPPLSCSPGVYHDDDGDDEYHDGDDDDDDDDDCDVAHETSQDICAALEKLSKTRWLPRLRHTLCLSSTAPSPSCQWWSWWEQTGFIDSETLLYYQVSTSWHLNGSLFSFSDRWTPGVCKVVSKVDQTRKHGRRRKQCWADRGSLAETAGEGSSPWWHLKEVERNRDRCSEWLCSVAVVKWKEAE